MYRYNYYQVASKDHQCRYSRLIFADYFIWYGLLYKSVFIYLSRSNMSTSRDRQIPYNVLAQSRVYKILSTGNQPGSLTSIFSSTLRTFSVVASNRRRALARSSLSSQSLLDSESALFLRLRRSLLFELDESSLSAKEVAWTFSEHPLQKGTECRTSDTWLSSRQDGQINSWQ